MNSYRNIIENKRVNKNGIPDQYEIYVDYITVIDIINDIENRIYELQSQLNGLPKINNTKRKIASLIKDLHY